MYWPVGGGDTVVLFYRQFLSTFGPRSEFRHDKSGTNNDASHQALHGEDFFMAGFRASSRFMIP